METRREGAEFRGRRTGIITRPLEWAEAESTVSDGLGRVPGSWQGLRTVSVGSQSSRDWVLCSACSRSSHLHPAQKQFRSHDLGL